MLLGIRLTYPATVCGKVRAGDSIPCPVICVLTAERRWGSRIAPGDWGEMSELQEFIQYSTPTSTIFN